MKKLIKAIKIQLSQADDIFKPAPPEEVVQRRDEWRSRGLEMLKEKGIQRSDGRYDFQCDVSLNDYGFTEIPKNFFGTVAGYFWCDGMKLTTLEGCPEHIGGDFDCSDNGTLMSLEGCPKEVGKNWYSYYNDKTVFTKNNISKVCKVAKTIFTSNSPYGEGSTKYGQADDIFKPASPDEVNERGKEYNKILIENLKKKGTRRSDGKYDFYNADIEALGLNGELPHNFFGDIRGFFWCDSNKLTSLEGCPESIGGSFSCCHNNLSSLEGCPKYVGGNFFCYSNEREFTEEEVRSVCEVHGQVHISIRESDRSYRDTKAQADDIFKPATEEEAAQRKEEYKGKFFDELKKKGTLRPDGKYDFEYVTLYGELLTELPQNFFGNIRRDFDCSGNNLISLKGCPEYVGGYFDCHGNQLESLEGCPKEVGDFYCRGNAKGFTREDITKYCKVRNFVTYDYWDM
jgi:hypothetical protein